jgi:hypothetical protein
LFSQLQPDPFDDRLRPLPPAENHDEIIAERGRSVMVMRRHPKGGAAVPGYLTWASAAGGSLRRDCLCAAGSSLDQANAGFSRCRVSPSPSGPLVDFAWGVRARNWICCAVVARKLTPGPWRPAMRRVVSLFLPAWATDRLRRRNGGLPRVEVPLITAMQDGNQRVIAAVDEAARRLKLRPGMTIAHAQFLIPDLQIHEAMPLEDEASLHRLALWCTRYSRLTAIDPPAGIFIDIAGSAHLFKGETAVLEDLKKRLAESKISSRAAVADTAGLCLGGGAFFQARDHRTGRGLRTHLAVCRLLSCAWMRRLSIACAMSASNASRNWRPSRAAACKRVSALISEQQHRT